MKPVKLGLIGAGRIGKLHAQNILQMPDAEIKLIADPYIDQNWANNYGLKFSKDPEAVFSDREIEGVLILSPSPLHADQIIRAAQTGKHIFCEKPIALDPEKIKPALDAVKKAGVSLQLGFNRRFDPNFIRLRTAVMDKKIGDLYYIRITSRDPAPPPIEYIKSSGGMFLDMTIHDFDMVRFLSGSEVDQVYAAGAVLVDSQFEVAGDIDTAIITLKLKNGAMAVIDNSREAVYGYDQQIELFGSKGSMRAGNETATRTVFCSSHGVRSDRPMDFFLDRYHISFVDEMKEFIRVIRDKKQPSVGGYDGLVSILIGLAAKKSLQKNIPVKVTNEFL